MPPSPRHGLFLTPHGFDMTDIKTLTPDMVTGLQHGMNLSDEQLSEVLGFSPKSGPRRIRKWKDGSEVPSGSAAALLVLISKLDTALRQIDNGEIERGHTTLRDAVPDFLQ